MLKTTIYAGRAEFLFLCSLHLCKKMSANHGIFLLIPQFLTVAFTAVQIYLGIHISLQDQSLVYLAVGIVDPFFLNFVWAHNYIPNIKKNVKKEIDFNFKLQRSSDNKNVVKMMKNTLANVPLFLGTIYYVVALRTDTCQFSVLAIARGSCHFLKKEKLFLM